jgi:hypothetical protein
VKWKQKVRVFGVGNGDRAFCCGLVTRVRKSRRGTSPGEFTKMQ